MSFDDYRDDVRGRLAAMNIPPHSATTPEIWAGYSERISADAFASSCAEWIRENDPDSIGCQGHPAGPFDPMGETVYCDGRCRSI